MPPCYARPEKGKEEISQALSLRSQQTDVCDYTSFPDCVDNVVGQDHLIADSVKSSVADVDAVLGRERKSRVAQR